MSAQQDKPTNSYKGFTKRGSASATTKELPPIKIKSFSVAFFLAARTASDTLSKVVPHNWYFSASWASFFSSSARSIEGFVK